MTKEEIKKIIFLYEEYQRKHPISHSWAEHAESDDWESYWNSVVTYISSKL